MSDNNKDAFNIVDFGAALKAKGGDDLVINALKGKLQDFLGSLSPAVRKRVDVLKEIQTQHDELEVKYVEERNELEAKYFEERDELEAKYFEKRDELEAKDYDERDELEAKDYDERDELEAKDYDERDELEAMYFEEGAALEAKYQKLYQPLYTKRYEIVNGAVEVEESSTGMNTADEKGVPDFWLNAMINNDVLALGITQLDQKALKFLKDIKWSRVDNPKGFKLEFHFDTNPFFKNTVLTKTYQMIEEEYEPILEKSIGTEIEWFPGKCLTQMITTKGSIPFTEIEQCDSFFNFFGPSQVSEEGDDVEEDVAQELQYVLEQNFNIGLTIRDKIIPNAVSWFTGEAAEDDYDNMQEDDDEDLDYEDEEDEDEDEEEDNEEDES